MKRTVMVAMEVEVSVDESTFTPEFMAEFEAIFFPLETIEDHICHIAQLEARGLLRRDFTKGYGPLSRMGIEACLINSTMSAEIEEG